MKRTLFLVSIFFLTGCAQLQVTVKLLNRDIFHEEEFELQNQFLTGGIAVAYDTINQYLNEFDKIKKNILDKIDSLYEEKKKNIDSIVIREIKSEVEIDLEDVKKLYSEGKNLYTTGGFQNKISAMSKWLEGERKLTELKKDLEQDLREKFAMKPDERIEEILKTGRDIPSVPKNSWVNTVSGDPYISFVISERKGDKEKYWENELNEAKGSGLFGNSDIAIKMEQDGRFTVKGMRLESSQVVNRTMTGVINSISLLSTLYPNLINVNSSSVSGIDSTSSFVSQGDTIDPMILNTLEEQKIKNEILFLMDFVIKESQMAKDSLGIEKYKKSVEQELSNF